ncbi:TetR family transcriptional regulator [Bacillus cereus]|uniref:TetR/AcrR family transcriptional regulator n=1 Tax=Bacillus cereus TaxID=1396 RepID=UPI000BEE4EAA|nr:TetR/AcrR family transcriptional regulator [Bacillus cereus]PED02716.1 TetR family transcriptional regulator [Bacillus cereus]PEQ81970.1 TetR family transcriptional regulator [Bacillus cereus]PES08879.1 TetR family transcriptional regulator [Bacillus cereus]PEU09432.1 TetR family transcriptional regulator [Bacillus cereus]PEX30624.1 TetR family transcriptional regulator [Bacillus cereus]
MLNHHQKQSEDTINKLMRSGIELFSKQGYSSTSVDQIVKHAGYSKGAFYAHFPTKEEFLLRLIKNGIDFYFEDLKEALTQKDCNLLNTFKEYSMRLVNEAYEKGASPMLLQGCMISNELPLIKERLIFQMEEWRSFLTHFFQKMKDEGIVGSPLDARTLATAGMALFNGYNLQHFVDNRIQIQEILSVFIELLQVREPNKEG